MKHPFALLAAGMLLFSCMTPDDTHNNNPVDKDLQNQLTAAYDSVLAQKLGADEIGMKKYVMAFLKKGPNRNQDSATAVEIQKGHMANINRMAEEGKLILAGPFLDDGEIRGIYIFNVQTVEEAEILTKTDPAIQSGRLVMELHPWYGSAALMEVNQIHKKLAKKEF
jgi:uncharacterized protein YciI